MIMHHIVNRRLFSRGLALVYVFAFCSLFIQYPHLYGCDGLQPAEVFLRRLKAHYGVDAFKQVPSFIWWYDHPIVDLPLDVWAQALGLLGIFASSVSLCGAQPSFAPFLMPLISWLCYLSLYSIGQTFLGFQWDILLLEMGFLGIMWSWAGSRVVRWSIRWLFFRLIFGSGVVKLQAECPTWLSLTALEYHYASQPLPTPAAWFAHQLPPFFHKFSVAATLFIQVPMGLLLLLPTSIFPVAAHLGVFLQVVLQVLIVVTGNYNFFNALALLMVFSVLDDSFWAMSGSGRKKCTGFQRLTSIALGCVFVTLFCSLFSFTQTQQPVPKSVEVSLLKLRGSPSPYNHLLALLWEQTWFWDLEPKYTVHTRILHIYLLVLCLYVASTNTYLTAHFSFVPVIRFAESFECDTSSNFVLDGWYTCSECL